MFINKSTLKALVALKNVDITLKPHQKEALEWMVNIERKLAPFGGIIADEMGLGKTLEMISLILGRPKARTLIIVPANLIPQWKSEFKKFAPEICVTDTLQISKDTNVVISSYVKASRNTAFFEYSWDRIILDEAHCIRNPKGAINKALMKLKGKHKWCLTGTPIHNYISDLKSLIKFIGITFIDDIQYISKHFILRRTKTQVDIQLPKICEENTHITITSKERNIYNQVNDNSYRDVEIHHLEKLLRLRQFAIMPQLSISGMNKKKKKLVIWSHANSKMNKVIESVKSSRTTDKPIIFAHFRKEIQYLNEKLTKEGIKARIIDGSVPIPMRKTIIDDHENYHVLIIQLQAGSTGLNLQMFDTVYFTSPHWNPTHEQQAIARVHRIGQTKPVKVKRFVIKDTIESHILKIQEHKTKMVNGLFA